MSRTDADLSTTYRRRGRLLRPVGHGRNRAEACRRAGVECPTRPYEGEDASILAFVASLNLQRRHLTTGQKAAIAAKMMSLRKEDNLKRGAAAPEGSKYPSGISSTRASEIMNVSRAQTVRAARLKRELPEVFEEVKAGKTPIGRAMAELDPKQSSRRSQAPTAATGHLNPTERAQPTAGALRKG